MPTAGDFMGGYIGRRRPRPEWERRRAKPKSFKGSKAAKRAARRK